MVQPGVGKPVSPAGNSMETAGSPKFPGNPRDHSPCLRPRWDQAGSVGQGELPGAAPAFATTRAPARRFRGSIAQRLISLSTLRSGGYPPPRKTRFRLLARLYRAGLVTRRVPAKGFTFLDSPFPSFFAPCQSIFSRGGRPRRHSCTDDAEAMGNDLDPVLCTVGPATAHRRPHAIQLLGRLFPTDLPSPAGPTFRLSATELLPFRERVQEGIGMPSGMAAVARPGILARIGHHHRPAPGWPQCTSERRAGGHHPG